MTKSELIGEVARKSGESKSAVARVLSALTKTIKTADSVQLAGFGTFKTVTRPARSGVSALNGKAWATDTRKVITFKASKVAKQ
jgi:DNA-binding protein HU-beta